MNTLFLEIIRMSLTGSGIIALVLLVRLMLKKAPKIYSYALWAVVLVRLLIPVGIPVAGLPRLNLLELPVQEIQVEPLHRDLPENLKPTVRLELRGKTPHQTAEMPRERNMEFQELISRVWMVGAWLVLSCGIISYIRFRRHLVGAVKLRKNIYEVDHIGAAYVVGLLRPRIYVDSGLPGDQLPYIVAHEQVHIRRLDSLTRGLAFLALSVHWFNPLVWMAFILSGRDMEMSCDEAVVSRMGPKVRGPYAQSLLTLATGQHIRLGCPVAFGEGSTKGRVRNLSRWKQAGKGCQRLCMIVTTFVLALCLCEPLAVEGMATQPGSQSERDKDVVTSITTFDNQEQSVNFIFNLQEPAQAPSMPIVEVEPHFLTEQEVQQIAKPFYGDVPIYDIGVQGERRYSRWEIQGKINLLSKYLTKESLEDIHLPQDNGADPALIPRELEAYEKMLVGAPEQVPHPIWDGTMENSPWLDEKHKVLNLFGYIDFVPYNLTVSQDSYRGQTWNQLGIRVSDGGGWETARYLTESLLHYGKKPNKDQARKYAAEALTDLNQVSCGDWYLDQVQIMDMGNDQGWVEVRFTGAIQGHPMLGQQQSQYFLDANLPGQLDVSLPYAVASYMEDQTLIELAMGNFLKEIRVEDPAPKLLSVEKLMEAAQSQLEQYDVSVLMPLQLRSQELDPEELRLQVYMTGIRYGMGIQKDGERYYAVPAAQFLGTVRCYQNGVLLGNSSESGDFLLTLNAVDGSVIG